MPMIDHITDEQADLIRNAKVFFRRLRRPRIRGRTQRRGPGQPLAQRRGRPPGHRPPHNRLLRLSRQRQRDRPPHRRRRPDHHHGHLVRRGRRHRPPLRPRRSQAARGVHPRRSGRSAPSSRYAHTRAPGHRNQSRLHPNLMRLRSPHLRSTRQTAPETNAAAAISSVRPPPLGEVPRRGGGGQPR